MTTLFSYIEGEKEKGDERLSYTALAILFILAVVVPLVWVLIFLKAVIHNLGDSTLVTKLPAEVEKEKEQDV
ncbi:hypothetical protein ACRS6Y_00265 [Bacillus cytotoxicus]|uniref:Transmembrane protein n=1 Tax=Bacillus cytotoxicus (strain DSM 22905 / CIP 110041 / 391-98 / NVH 391-98) TaxID=315749 RepID=A7GNY2_BACCN|nr:MULTISPECIES: hypothetical protein [Bacillus cereus group]ABS21840.1 hypothetical protein Bcer98_1527 [Bacillus cytotoxicus NVH 391-98]KMT50952.1 hypothetical protein TU51_08200 [Bacillus cytotoxicus]MDH2861320.1 hypothetical protein [Bacillus cytotoxicus]MDH2863202.1 hypothetical protein [Bacillus cytotoxicus]MDH2869037.1 hypothetical protein [Bacillus cytotoxicus]